MTEIKDDIGYFENVFPVMDMIGFARLLLADLAIKSKVIYFNGWKDNVACLNGDYKARIEEIMYSDNGWAIKFSKLIDIKHYFNNQLTWEHQFSLALQSVLTELKKEWYYDFGYDDIKVSFNQNEIDKIKEEYDKETLEVMDHFSSLLSNVAMGRKWQLEEKKMTRRLNRQREKNRSFMYNQMRRAGIKNPSKYIK